MQKKPILENEFNEWKLHPVTDAFFTTLKKWREDQKEVWASGAFTAESKYGSDILSAQAVAYCKTLEALIDLQFEQLQESE
jgi:hypothetical protein